MGKYCNTKEQNNLSLQMVRMDSLKFIRLLRFVFSSQQRLNQPAINGVQ